jgi:DnaJ like chaperone protein
LLSPIFEILGELALADGALCKQEEFYLQRATYIFKMDNYKGSHYKNPFAILGCQIDDSVEKIKRIYRHKMVEFHPDRMANLGLPKEFIHFGNVRFREIQTAYEIIKAKKQIK